MNKILISAVAGVAVGYFVRKIQDRAHTMEICGNGSRIGNRTTKDMEDICNKEIDKDRSLSDSVQAE